MKRKNLFIVSTFFVLTFLCTSCQSTKLDVDTFKSKHNELKFVFCGDVMAHTQNFRMNDYSLIWNDIKIITQNSDFTLANIEAPINDSIPFENYPTFNMQYSYPQAAIDAGINVITVANNHTNDKLFSGILSTAAWTNYITQKYESSKRKVYVSGLKEEVFKNYSTIEKYTSVNHFLENHPNCNISIPSYSIFEKNNIKIAFLGVTQLLNQPNSSKFINYFPSTKKAQEDLILQIKKIKEKNNIDIFILALHSDEVEYVLTVDENRKKYYKQLLDSGVDIIWSNHPHVVKPIEYIMNKKTNKIEKIIMYATGNTISAQRRYPNFNNPENIHEYTGDGIIFSINAKKKNNKIFFENSKIDYITTFIDEQKNGTKNFVIKKLDQSFLEQLEKNKNFIWKNYLQKRLNLLKDIKEIQTWQ